jgi:hypothetical protein
MREYINLKDEVQLNTKDADHKVCEYCHLPITLIPGRGNRVDCEDGKGLVSYHLWCYDMAVMEKLTYLTKKAMIEMLVMYGDI